MKENNLLGKVSQIGIYVVLVGIVVFLIAQSRGKDERWECGQTVCTRLMTQKEIVDRFCFLQEQKFVCSLNIDGRPAVVPLDALNLSSIQVCSEFRCVKEVMVRPANYSLNISVR